MSQYICLVSQRELQATHPADSPLRFQEAALLHKFSISCSLMSSLESGTGLLSGGTEPGRLQVLRCHVQAAPWQATSARHRL